MGALSDYLRECLGASGSVDIQNAERIAVGWSHETWLFEAVWPDGAGEQRQAFCLRRDPGNALLRQESDLGEQFRVLKCLEADGCARPAWRSGTKPDPAVSRRPPPS